MEYPIYFKNGLTVRELKKIIKDWDEEYPNGELTTVWISGENGQSNDVESIWRLNVRENGISDILFEI